MSRTPQRCITPVALFGTRLLLNLSGLQLSFVGFVSQGEYGLSWEACSRKADNRASHNPKLFVFFGLVTWILVVFRIVFQFCVKCTLQVSKGVADNWREPYPWVSSQNWSITFLLFCSCWHTLYVVMHCHGRLPWWCSPCSLSDLWLVFC